MRTRLLLALLVTPTGALANQDSNLQSGEYEVQMRLELPHVEDMNVQRAAKVCITETGTHGIVVLSENNPLVRCPAENIKESAGELTFDLICEGHNQAVASAKFRLHRERFDGAFNMKMGGKNMTMTERQSGKRVGDCANQPRS